MPDSDWRRATRSAIFSAAGLRCGARWLRGRFDQQGELAADAVAVGEFPPHVRHGSAQKLLVNLGQLAGRHDAQLRSPDGFQIGQRVQDAVRGLVENQGARSLARLGGELFQAGAAGSGLLRQESDEMKLVGGQAGGDQGAEGRIGAGNGNDRHAGGDGFGDEPAAGIADAGHAGVGDNGDASALP